MRQWVVRLVTVWAGVCVMSLTGCGDGRPKAIPVGGTVRYKGKEVPVGALVVFHPSDPGREKQIGGKPFGKVAEDGTLKLTTYASGDGAPEGEYGVTIDWRPPPEEGKFRLSSEGGMSTPPNKLQGRFSDPNKPFTKVTVKAGADNNFTFEVE